MRETTTIRKRGFGPDGILLEGSKIIPGGYYDRENNLITPKVADPKLGRMARCSQQSEYNAQFHERIKDSDVSYLKGKRLLILDYAYEPDDDANFSLDTANRTSIFFLKSVINRILGCESSCYYYFKITCSYPGIIDRDKFQAIIKEVVPDYVWIIGFDLFNRLPSIIGKGPTLFTARGHANTFLMEGASANSSVICLPMPHPKTPGFDSEVEIIWHDVVVELLKQ